MTTRSRVALGMRREWVIAAALGCALIAVLGWAWADGGKRPVRLLSQPVVLPEAGR